MNEFLKGILDGINAFTGNYGWAVVLFTLLIRLILFPFDYKSRVSMRKTTKLQPEIARIQKKYAKDQEKMNLKLSELYRKEKINPLSSCLPMLLTLPILYAMFGAMRMVANEHMAHQVFDILQGNTPVLEGWLWVKNIWMPDSPFSPIWPDLAMMRNIPTETWTAVFNSLGTAVQALPGEMASLTAESFASGNLQATIQSIYSTMQTLPNYQAATAAMPGGMVNLIFAQFALMQNFNGLFLLPLLSGASQYLMTVLQPTAAPSGDASQQSTANFMKWFFPLFSLWICASYNALFAIYWVVSNLIAMAQTAGINKFLDAREAKEAEELSNVEGSIK